MPKVTPTFEVKASESDDLLLEKYVYTQSGEINAFAAHVHPEYQFALSLEVDGCYRYRGSNLRFASGNLCVLHSGEPHTTGEKKFLDAGTSFWVLYVNTEKMRQIAGEIAGKQSAELPFFPEVVLRDPVLIRLYLRLFAERFASTLERETANLAFFARLLKFHAQNFSPATELRLDVSAVAKAREFLDANFLQNVSLDNLADVAGISKFHLVHLFRRRIGISPHAYQIQLRISFAKKLLLSRTSPADVAEITGFYDQSHFGKFFKSSVGVTPQQFLCFDS